MDPNVVAQPGVGFIMMLIIGALAGWLAEKFTSSNHGIFTNILVGIAGSFIGNAIANMLGIAVVGFLGTLISAVLGAVLLLFVWRALTQRRAL